MSTVIIAKNQTVGDLLLKSLSAPDARIPGSGQVTLTDYNFVWNIQEDVELRGYINAGDVILNVDGKDLNKEESLNAASAPSMAKNTDDLHDTQSEPTGFPNRTDSAVSRVDGSRTFTVQPAVTSFDFYIAGSKYTKTVAQNRIWPDAEGVHYFYFDTAGVLQTTQAVTADLFLKYALVALLYWDFSNKASVLFADERHGIQMNGETHLHLHRSFGARWTDGLALQGITADGDGNNNISAQLSVENGAIRDEDLQFNILDDSPQDLAPIAQIPVLYRVGAAGDWRKKTADNFPIVYQGTAGYPATQRLPFNEFTGGVWGFTEAGVLRFVCVHVFGSNDKDEPIIGVQGQVEYSTVVDARNGAPTEVRNLLLGSLPTPEMTPLGTVIFQTSSGYANTPKARVRSDGLGNPYIDLRRTDLVGVAGGGGTDVFGAYYDRQESLAESSTTSILWDNTKVALTTPAVSGEFRLAWSAMCRNADKKGEARLYNLTDAVMVGAIQPFRVKDSTDNYPRFSAVHKITLTGSAKTYELQWRGTDGQTHSIKDASIEFWRVR